MKRSRPATGRSGGSGGRARVVGGTANGDKDGMRKQPATRLPAVVRFQHNLLASSERTLLAWLCRRMPAWVTPDLLTLCGLAGAALVFAGYVASLASPAWLWLAIGGYALQWFGDSMDGSLARYRRIERPSYGYFVDHSCDGIATLLILGGIGLSPFVRLDVALVALTGYLLLSIHVYLAARVTGEFRLSYLAGGPTELRIILVALTVAMLVFGPGPQLFGLTTGFDIFVGAAGTLLIVLFVSQTVATARRIASCGG